MLCACLCSSAQFPDSLRVKRLEGMMWEAKGEVCCMRTNQEHPCSIRLGLELPLTTVDCTCAAAAALLPSRARSVASHLFLAA